MDAAQLRTALKQLGVTPPDELRASLYLQVLRDAKTFFSQTMALQPNVNPNGMGANYAFVKAAVTSSSLLTELAEILDLFLGPAIDRDMNLWQPANPFTYQQYFNARILNPNDVTYAANVTAFYQRFPIAAGAVQAITNNFQQNILQACRRVVQDKAALTSLYDNDYEWLTITGLKRIKSTGSDFHKGGKQVLILTFSIRYWIFGESAAAPLWGELKTVYKPSDIEADCLIIGNSAAVRNADPTFPITASLTEIINGLIATEKRNNPQSTLETLPTYRILPRNYISQQPQPTVYPLHQIRDAYGYIEHLDYETTLPGKIWSLFSYGASDFLIFPDQNEQEIVPQFYRRVGQLLAIACTFSLQDLHLQNVRVMSYLPYLIDLEICLVKPVNSAYETSLFGQVNGVEAGGITGETLAIEEQVWVWGNKPRAQLEPFFPPKTYQNRLYAMRPTRKLVPPSAFYIIRGFNRLMEILQTGVNNNSFDGWFTRLRGVLVRYTPYATSDFKQVREIIIMTTNGVNNNAPLIPTIQTVLDNKVQDEFQKYQQARTPQPDFLAYQFAVSGTDFQNMDIPVFYHRIGAPGVANSLDLMDSQGRQVAIPVQININGVMTNTNIGRATFFANLPTAITVRQGQLQVLSVDPGFTQRRTALRNTILRGLGRQGVPRRPETLIP
jgi:hypothetical protein